MEDTAVSAYYHRSTQHDVDDSAARDQSATNTTRINSNETAVVSLNTYETTNNIMNSKKFGKKKKKHKSAAGKGKKEPKSSVSSKKHKSAAGKGKKKPKSSVSSKSKGGSSVKCKSYSNKSKGQKGKGQKGEGQKGKGQKGKGGSASIQSSKGKGSRRSKSASSSYPSIRCDPSLYFGYAVCGSNACQLRSLVHKVFDLETTTSAVRCCSDADPVVGTSWVQSCSEYSGLHTWGTSRDAEGNCLPRNATLLEAMDICDGLNARLCDTDELKSQCASDSTEDGCGFDDVLVWSNEFYLKNTDRTYAPSQYSNSPTVGTPTIVSYIGYALRTSCLLNATSSEERALQVEQQEEDDILIVPDINAARFPVRCCADTCPNNDANWIQTCSEESGYNSWGCNRDESGTCFPYNATYHEAVDVCEKVGGRLCTVSELIGRCCCSPMMSGCNGPEASPLTWAKDLDVLTQEPTPSPSWSDLGLVACGGNQCNPPKVTKRVPLETAQYPVRCCTDTTPTVGAVNWLKKCDNDSGYDVWGSSRDQNGVCYSEQSTYSEALKICTDEGARLCSIAELQAGCTMKTGCGYDDKLIWTIDREKKTNNPSVSMRPSNNPSMTPSLYMNPSSDPSMNPSVSIRTSNNPSMTPSLSTNPSSVPSMNPSVSMRPSNNPSMTPSLSMNPSSDPSMNPSVSMRPSNNPSMTPSLSMNPSSVPSMNPSVSMRPSNDPSMTPSLSTNPSSGPSMNPSVSMHPSNDPSMTPSLSMNPSSDPSMNPSVSMHPSNDPSMTPSLSTNPSSVPSMNPSVSMRPSNDPSMTPSLSTNPSSVPSMNPSSFTASQISGYMPSTKPSVSLSPSSSVRPSFYPSVSNSPTVSVPPTKALTPEPSSLPSSSSSPTVSGFPSISPTISVAPSVDLSNCHITCIEGFSYIDRTCSCSDDPCDACPYGSMCVDSFDGGKFCLDCACGTCNYSYDPCCSK